LKKYRGGSILGNLPVILFEMQSIVLLDEGTAL